MLKKLHKITAKHGMYSSLPNRRHGLNKRPGGNFLKSNKRPVLNKCPGTKFSLEFRVKTFLF